MPSNLNVKVWTFKHPLGDKHKPNSRNRFYPKVKPNQDDPTVIEIRGCRRCVLFRSRRRGARVASGGPCNCTGRGLSVFRTVYKLDPRKLARGSGFDKYRKGIKDQLKKHPEFFFLHFLSCLEVQTVENPEDLGFVHVLIRINAPGVENKKEGLTVKQVEFVLFDAKDRGDGARLGRPLREWKNKVKVGHIGISFAFNFKVYYPKNAVFFGVLLGMQMEKGKFSYARREKLVLEPALYRWWDAEIQEVLGDHVGNSRRRAPETSRRKSRKRSRSPRSLAPPKPAYYENHEGFIDESCRIPVPQCVIC